MFFQVTKEIEQKQVRYKELLTRFKDNELTLKEFNHILSQEEIDVMDIFPSIADVWDLCKEIGVTKNQYAELDYTVWMS